MKEAQQRGQNSGYEKLSQLTPEELSRLEQNPENIGTDGRYAKCNAVAVARSYTLSKVVKR